MSAIPPGVVIVAAAKNRSCGEVKAAIESGISIIGENYVQEAAKAKNELVLDNPYTNFAFHFIGHLQPNKVKKAVELFDMIETVDSILVAEELSRQTRKLNKVMPVLIEVNVACEPQKHGVLPQNLLALAAALDSLPYIKLQGLMTMGPHTDEHSIRPYFAETRRLFEQLGTMDLKNADLLYLSMGMSDSYRTAIDEGANLIRLGTAIFGKRNSAY